MTYTTATDTDQSPYQNRLGKAADERAFNNLSTCKHIERLYTRLRLLRLTKQDLEKGTSKTGDRQPGVHTSTPHAALGAEPLPGGDGLGSLPDAAHVVRCRAAITAQQTAAQTTQHTQVSVAVILQLRRCCCRRCCLTPSAPPFFFAVILAVTIGLCE